MANDVTTGTAVEGAEQADAGERTAPDGRPTTVQEVLDRAAARPAGKQGVITGRLTSLVEEADGLVDEDAEDTGDHATSGDEGPDKATSDAKDSATASAKTPGAKAGAKGPEKAVPKGADKRAYRVTRVAEDGTVTDAADIAWPDGAVVAIKAGGKVREFRSFDDLATAVTNGVENQAAISRAGERARQADLRAVEAEKRAVENERRGEDLLLLSLFGGRMKDPATGETREMTPEEVRDILGPTLEKWQDPEYRQAMEERRARHVSDEQAKLARDEQQREAVAVFWSAVDDEIGAALGETADEGAPAFPWLTPDDTNDIKALFNRGYLQRVDELKQTYRRNAAAHGIPVEQADALAEVDAREVLTEENLRALMRAMNDRYADRIARRGARNGAGKERGAGTPPGNGAAASAEQGRNGNGADAEREVRAHNDRMEQHAAQRDRNQTLRGPGGVPSAASGPPAADLDARRNLSWNERRKGMLAKLRDLRE